MSKLPKCPCGGTMTWIAKDEKWICLNAPIGDSHRLEIVPHRLEHLEEENKEAIRKLIKFMI